MRRSFLATVIIVTGLLAYSNAIDLNIAACKAAMLNDFGGMSQMEMYTCAEILEAPLRRLEEESKAKEAAKVKVEAEKITVKMAAAAKKGAVDAEGITLDEISRIADDTKNYSIPEECIVAREIIAMKDVEIDILLTLVKTLKTNSMEKHTDKEAAEAAAAQAIADRELAEAIAAQATAAAEAAEATAAQSAAEREEAAHGKLSAEATAARAIAEKEVAESNAAEASALAEAAEAARAQATAQKQEAEAEAARARAEKEALEADLEPYIDEAEASPFTWLWSASKGSFNNPL